MAVCLNRSSSGGSGGPVFNRISKPGGLAGATAAPRAPLCTPGENQGLWGRNSPDWGPPYPASQKGGSGGFTGTYRAQEKKTVGNWFGRDFVGPATLGIWPGLGQGKTGPKAEAAGGYGEMLGGAGGGKKRRDGGFRNTGAGEAVG